MSFFKKVHISLKWSTLPVCISAVWVLLGSVENSSHTLGSPNHFRYCSFPKFSITLCCRSLAFMVLDVLWVPVSVPHILCFAPAGGSVAVCLLGLVGSAGSDPGKQETLFSGSQLNPKKSIQHHWLLLWQTGIKHIALMSEWWDLKGTQISAGTWLSCSWELYWASVEYRNWYCSVVWIMPPLYSTKEWQQVRHSDVKNDLDSERTVDTHLSSRSWQTVSRMSICPVSLSCWQPMLLTMKQPVLPIPALRGYRTGERSSGATALISRVLTST